MLMSWSLTIQSVAVCWTDRRENSFFTYRKSYKSWIRVDLDIYKFTPSIHLKMFILIAVVCLVPIAVCSPQTINVCKLQDILWDRYPSPSINSFVLLNCRPQVFINEADNEQAAQAVDIAASYIKKNSILGLSVHLITVEGHRNDSDRFLGDGNFQFNIFSPPNLHIEFRHFSRPNSLCAIQGCGEK